MTATLETEKPPFPSAVLYSQMSTLAKAPEPTLRMNLRRENGMRGEEEEAPRASAAAAAPLLLPSTLPSALSPPAMFSKEGALSGWSRTDSRSRCL